MNLTVWTKTFATGVFIALCIVFLPLTVFLALVFKKTTVEKFLESLLDETEA